MIKLRQDILVGFGFNEFEIFFDAPDEGFDFIDSDYGLLASF